LKTKKKPPSGGFFIRLKFSLTMSHTSGLLSVEVGTTCLADKAKAISNTGITACERPEMLSMTIL